MVCKSSLQRSESWWFEGTEGRYECRSGARRNRRPLRVSERCSKEPKAASSVGAVLEGTEGCFECRSAA
jgi:hypothetical protein